MGKKRGMEIEMEGNMQPSPASAQETLPSGVVKDVPRGMVWCYCDDEVQLIIVFLFIYVHGCV